MRINAFNWLNNVVYETLSISEKARYETLMLLNSGEVLPFIFEGKRYHQRCPSWVAFKINSSILTKDKEEYRKKQ